MCGWCPAGKCHKIIKIVLLAIVLGAIVSAFCGHGDRRSNVANQNTIVVSGKGDITVKPDIANLSFSVMEENKDVSKASDAVNTKIAAIVNALKADGIDEKDIKTTDYSINPRYDYVNVTSTSGIYTPGKQVLAGYDVTDSIEVKIRDLSKAGKIVTDLGGLSVTNMSGLTFTEDKYDALVKQARDEAIADARTQAASLAKSLGVKLDKIVGYSDDQPTPIYYGAMKTTAMPMAADVSAVLPSGQNTITSNVTITYEIQ
jgi:uncharacterized protein YggE